VSVTRPENETDAPGGRLEHDVRRGRLGRIGCDLLAAVGSVGELDDVAGLRHVVPAVEGRAGRSWVGAVVRVAAARREIEGCSRGGSGERQRRARQGGDRRRAAVHVAQT